MAPRAHTARDFPIELKFFSAERRGMRWQMAVVALIKSSEGGREGLDRLYLFIGLLFER
jgi:hypothetical protein